MIRVLVADADASVVRFISRAFRARGWHVDGATDASSIVELVCTGLYQLVVLDVASPQSDGLRTLHQVCSVRPDQTVIALTGRAASDLGVRALESGASDYVGKPFSIDELLARASVRLRGAAAAPQARVLFCGPVTLDLARRKVDTGQGEISLTEREFVLLAHLMSDEGRVFSRQELLAAVWGFSFDPGSNVVDVYIRRLRGKLGGNYIETVRNVGYSLRAAA